MPRSFGTFPYRPQRYHAWDVFETSPRITFPDPLSKIQTFPILNFSEQGLCLECPQQLNYIQCGDLLRSIQVLFADKVVFSGDAKVKHAGVHKSSGKWHYGLRFIEGKLNIPEIFSLRDQLQDRSLTVERLRRIQRVPRYEKDFLNQFQVQAFVEREGRKVSVQIENVSEFGFCFSLDAMADVELFAGSVFVPDSILEKLSFAVDGKILFEGRVRIIHIQKEPFQLKAGVFCLDGLSVPLSGFETALKLREAKKGFLMFLERAEQSERIYPEFKIALNDFRYFLEMMKSYLDNVESQINHLSGREEQESAFNMVRDFSSRFLSQNIRSLIEKIEKVVTIFTKEEDEIHRKYFQDQMLDLTKGSIVFRRALEKPLGYPGDYEIMNGLYHKIYEGETLWEKLINGAFTHMEGPQAVRNRAQYLQGKIEKTIRDNRDKDIIYIMSVACGPCEEIQRYLRSELTERNAELCFYLLDQETQALTYAQRRLYPLVSKLPLNMGKVNFQFLQQGIKYLLNNPDLVKSYPKMDLIYSAGLFDYLSESIAQKLTAVLLSMLKEGGLLVIGNFNKYYPAKFFIEYISDWFLIHRSQQELMNFLPDDAWRSHATIEQEATGSTLFLNVRKPLSYPTYATF